MPGRTKQDDGTQCPVCGEQGGVYKTIGPRRYRKCPFDGTNWVTRELPADLVDAFVGSAQQLEGHLAHVGALASRLQIHAGMAYELAALDNPVGAITNELDQPATTTG